MEYSVGDVVIRNSSGKNIGYRSKWEIVDTWEVISSAERWYKILSIDTGEVQKLTKDVLDKEFTIANRSGAPKATELINYVIEGLNPYDVVEAQWTGAVATAWHPPEGLFASGSASDIASTLKGASDDLQQAMARLNFYINRAGKNLDPKRKQVLNKSKELLRKLYK